MRHWVHSSVLMMALEGLMDGTDEGVEVGLEVGIFDGNMLAVQR